VLIDCRSYENPLGEPELLLFEVIIFVLAPSYIFK
jgi:hypothetical protein